LVWINYCDPGLEKDLEVGEAEPEPEPGAPEEEEEEEVLEEFLDVEDDVEVAVNDPAPVELQCLTYLGACEALFLFKKESLPDLIAMVQGLWYEAGDDMRVGWMVDLEEDEFLKSMPLSTTLFFQRGRTLTFLLRKRRPANQAAVLDVRPITPPPMTVETLPSMAFLNVVQMPS
jgi:hypothetical protein